MLESYEREAVELAAILDTMADGVFVIDPDRRILRWNRAMERLTGYSAEEAVGESCSVLRGSCREPGDFPFVSLNCELFARGEADRIETRTVDMHIAKLRKKLGHARDLIETVRGEGYRLAV